MKKRESIEEIEKEITEIKDSWPAHTPSQAMLLRLEELEEKLIRLRKDQKGEKNTSN